MLRSQCQTNCFITVVTLRKINQKPWKGFVTWNSHKQYLSPGLDKSWARTPGITKKEPFILAMSSLATRFDWHALPCHSQPEHSEADCTEKFDQFKLCSYMGCGYTFKIKIICYKCVHNFCYGPQTFVVKQLKFLGRQPRGYQRIQKFVQP